MSTFVMFFVSEQLGLNPCRGSACVISEPLIELAYSSSLILSDCSQFQKYNPQIITNIITVMTIENTFSESALLFSIIHLTFFSNLIILSFSSSSSRPIVLMAVWQLLSVEREIWFCSFASISSSSSKNISWSSMLNSSPYSFFFLGWLFPISFGAAFGKDSLVPIGIFITVLGVAAAVLMALIIHHGG
jgi:hypothetical protein